MRQLGANIRMKDSGDVLKIEDDQGKIHTEILVRERSGPVHNQLDFAQLKFDLWEVRIQGRETSEACADC